MISNILIAHENKEELRQVEENWISTDIRDAVVANYHQLIKQLKQAGRKGMPLQMGRLAVKSMYLLFTLTLFAALLMPEFAAHVGQRMTPASYVATLDYWFIGLNGMFGIPWQGNYVVLGLFIIGCYWLSKCYYWRQASPVLLLSLSVMMTVAISYSLIVMHVIVMDMNEQLYQGQEALLPVLYAGSFFVSLYLLGWCLVRPQAWYWTIHDTTLSIMVIVVLQIALLYFNQRLEVFEHANYGNELLRTLIPAMRYSATHYIEVFACAIALSYFITDYRVWHNTKAQVDKYNSPILRHSMGMPLY